MSYANVVWANCDEESVYRVLRLQKRTERVISYVDRITPSFALFNKLSCIPFYEQHKIDKCITMYKPIINLNSCRNYIALQNMIKQRALRVLKQKKT